MPMATSNFLVPNGTFIFELIAFLIVLGVIGWKVLPPLNRMLGERQDQIRGEMDAADQAKTDAEQADSERRNELEKARQQAREIVAQANRTADQVTLARQAQAQAEYERIVNSAEAEVAVARRRRHREHHRPGGGDRPGRGRTGDRARDPGLGPPGPHRRGHRRRVCRGGRHRCGHREWRVNPALQGYLAAVSETLADAGALAEAAAELRGVVSLVDGSNELSLALNDAALSVAARRAVLDDLLDGKVRPEVRNLVAKAVTVVPASELIGSFHWLASETTSLAERPEAERDGTSAEAVLGRLAARNRVTGYAAGVFETLTTQQIEELEDQLFRFTRTVESSRRAPQRAGRPGHPGPRAPRGHCRPDRRAGPAGHPAPGRLRRPGRSGPGHRRHPRRRGGRGGTSEGLAGGPGQLGRGRG